MIWILLREACFYVFLILSIYFVAKKKYVDLLALHFWSFTFAFCFKYFITIWSPDKIVNLSIIFCILFHKPWYRNKNLMILSRIVVILIFVIGFSDAYAILTPKTYFYPQISSIQRIVMQNFAYFMIILLLLFGPYLERGFINKLYPKYCLAVECAIVVGIIHYIFLLFGFEFLPIYRAQSENSEGSIVIAEFGGNIVKRLYGFSGEPKGLAFFIVPYLIMSIVNISRNYINRSLNYHLTFLILGLFVFFNTYSSSAFITFILTIPFVLYYIKLRLPKQTKRIIPLLLILFLGIIINNVWTNDDSISSFASAINERTFERGETELENDRQESVIFEHFINDDLRVLLFGWGVGQYTFNVPGQVASGNILVPVQSGLILTLADFGLVGLFIYVLIFSIILKLLNKTRCCDNPLPFAFAMAAMTKFVESTMHGSLVTSFVFLMIAMYGYEDWKLKKNKYI